MLTGEAAGRYGPEITGFPLWIGRTQGITAAAFFKGRLDDMAVYNYPLDEAEIRHRAGAVVAEAAGNAGLPTTLVISNVRTAEFIVAP